MNLSSPANIHLDQRAPAKPERHEPVRDTSRDASRDTNRTQNIPARPQARSAYEPDRPARDSTRVRHGESERMADGLFFQQLLAPLGGMGGQEQGSSGGSRFAAPTEGTGSAALTGWNQLVDDLAVRLPPGAGQALQATLFMPNLGRIGMNARSRSPRGWDIELDCAEAHAAEHLRQNHARCQGDLSRALSQPVDLTVQHRGCA
jgi:hypothetical protein